MTDSISNETVTGVIITTDTPTNNPEAIPLEIKDKDPVAMIKLKPLRGKQYDALALEQVLQAVAKFGISGKYLRMNNKLYDISIIPALNAKIVVVDVITGQYVEPFPKLEDVFVAIQTLGYNGGILKIGNTYARASAFKIASMILIEELPMEEPSKI